MTVMTEEDLEAHFREVVRHLSDEDLKLDPCIIHKRLMGARRRSGMLTYQGKGPGNQLSRPILGPLMLEEQKRRLHA